LGRKVARAISPLTLGLRRVSPEDAQALHMIMTSCVDDVDAFYGKCGVWSLDWARDFVQRSPLSPVLTMDGTAVAFFEIPVMKPPPAALAAGASAEEADKFAIRERNRVTFRATAVGIAFDQFSRPDCVTLFRTVLYHGFMAARAFGYEYVEAW